MERFLPFALLFVIYISCNSMLQNKGVVNYYNTLDKRQQMYYTNNRVENDFIDYSLIDKSLTYFDSQNINKKLNTSEVITMESMLTELTTAITSAIAGVYCLVKVIMNIVAKFKK